jgi:hypothetical protein
MYFGGIFCVSEALRVDRRQFLLLRSSRDRNSHVGSPGVHRLGGFLETMTTEVKV